MTTKIVIITDVQFDALYTALTQFCQNERLHLEERSEVGEHDAQAWARLEAAEAYEMQLSAVLAAHAEAP